MEKRFSKQSVSEIIMDEVTKLENKYNFDTTKGTAQLTEDNQIILFIAYGKWIALRELHEELFGDDKNFYRV